MKKPKIFTIDYLMSAELSDEDLHYLFDTSSLFYSLICAEFEISGIKKTIDDILRLIKLPNWQYSFFWTPEIESQFELKLNNIYKNIYQYNDAQCKSAAQWFIIQYGLSNKQIKNSKHNNQL